MTAFTNGPVILELKPGGKFELFGGNIYGTFKELVSDCLNDFKYEVLWLQGLV